MASVLACGDGAVVSHASAGHLFGILSSGPENPEVTVSTTAGRARPGIVVHRVAALPLLETLACRGIPTTTVPRLLLDLAPRLTAPALARACHEAWVRYRVSPGHVEACIGRNPHKPGAKKLRRAQGSDVTLSELEDCFLDLLKRHDLRLPRTNIEHGGDKVDCRWPGLDLTIELVSYRYHGSRHGFEQDIARRRRSNHVQYSYGDVVERGAQTAAEIADLLQGRARAGDGAVVVPRISRTGVCAGHGRLGSAVSRSAPITSASGASAARLVVDRGGRGGGTAAPASFYRSCADGVSSQD